MALSLKEPNLSPKAQTLQRPQVYRLLGLQTTEVLTLQGSPALASEGATLSPASWPVDSWPSPTARPSSPWACRPGIVWRVAVAALALDIC